jgi:hypothetical protein
MRERAALGFAVNGRFDLDAGRARRAGNSERNRELARQIGDDAGNALGKLFERTRTDWTAVREELGLVPDLAVHDFWHGIWVGLTAGWLERQWDVAEELMRELTLALLKRLSDRAGAVPNGLTGPFQALVSNHEVRYELPKGLAAPPVIEVLGSWDRFTAKYSAGFLVSEGIGAILKHTGLARPAWMGLAALIAVLDPPGVQPQDARALGRVMRLTEEDSGWKLIEVKKRLKRRQFRTQADGWAEVSRLLAGAGNLIGQEEVLRHRLAPLDRRLHQDYYADGEDEAPAMVFFLACRGSMQAPAAAIARWVRDAIGSLRWMRA